MPCLPSRLRCQQHSCSNDPSFTLYPPSAATCHAAAAAACHCCCLLLFQAPGLPFSLPKEYASLPHLVGRATVELTVEKADDSLAFVDNVNGGLSKQAKVGAVPSL